MPRRQFYLIVQVCERCDMNWSMDLLITTSFRDVHLSIVVVHQTAMVIGWVVFQLRALPSTDPKPSQPSHHSWLISPRFFRKWSCLIVIVLEQFEAPVRLRISQNFPFIHSNHWSWFQTCVLGLLIKYISTKYHPHYGVYLPQLLEGSYISCIYHIFLYKTLNTYTALRAPNKREYQ